MYGTQDVNCAITLNHGGLIYSNYRKGIYGAIHHFQSAEVILLKLAVSNIKLAELYHNLAICYGYLSN